MNHSDGQDKGDDNDEHDLWLDRKVSNGGYGHHANKYHDGSCCDDARIGNRGDGTHYPNDAVDHWSELKSSWPGIAALQIIQLSNQQKLKDQLAV